MGRLEIDSWIDAPKEILAGDFDSIVQWRGIAGSGRADWRGLWEPVQSKFKGYIMRTLCDQVCPPSVYVLKIPMGLPTAQSLY